ncbi:MAG: methyltransferase domain-containing protein [Planctomycetes bacterium]|nr:methyltransferase domain-containing protein [Planctomycetota bacterium]
MQEQPDFDADDVDWDRLLELRDGFLDGATGSYWRNAADVELYDTTFGRRIAWKWTAVVDELAARGFVAPGGRWLDWGAGSAIATREMLSRSAQGPIERVTLVDRSAPALEFARKALAKERPKLAVETKTEVDAEQGPFDLVLVSHVISELHPHDLGRLTSLLATARAFVWVESAARDGSRALSAVREQLLAQHDPIAPCAHREACGVLSTGRESDWCHFFAAPPPHVFTSREWALFGRKLGVDLRSLPYSFLAMRARADAQFPAQASRLLGRARAERASLRFLCCEASGLRDRRFLRRHDGKLFNQLSETRLAPKLVRWRFEGDEIVGVDERLA